MPDNTLDVFKSDAFSSASLSASINALPFKPGRLGAMGIFRPKPINTNVAWIEEKGGTLTLISNTKRGAPSNLHNQGARTARAVGLPHLPIEDQVLAADVQDIRKFGSTNALEAVAEVVAEHLQAMGDNIEVTVEHMRASALAGKVLDADGSTELVDLFALFGVTEQTEDFKFGTDDIRADLLTVKGIIEDELGGIPFDHVHGVAGAAWFAAYIADSDVQAAFDLWRSGEFLRNDPRRGFEFAGVIIEEYRHSVGGVGFVDTDQVRFFPVGTNLGIEIYGPADFVETVNTLGLPKYAKQEGLDFDRGVRLHVQSNPLPIFMKPKTLVKGTKST